MLSALGGYWKVLSKPWSDLPFLGTLWCYMESGGKGEAERPIHEEAITVKRVRNNGRLAHSDEKGEKRLPVLGADFLEVPHTSHIPWVGEPGDCDVPHDLVPTEEAGTLFLRKKGGTASSSRAPVMLESTVVIMLVVMVVAEVSSRRWRRW